MQRHAWTTRSHPPKLFRQPCLAIPVTRHFRGLHHSLKQEICRRPVRSAAATEKTSANGGKELGTVLRLALPGIATANFIATENLSAINLSPEELAKRRFNAATSLSNSIFLAIVLGVLGSGVISVYGYSWLQAVGTDPAVLPLAAQYLAIRSLATPAVLVMNACQGACLGQQDTLTPMWICGIATLINIVGDIGLVFGAGMGVAGAALATAGAQVCAAGLIVWRVWQNGKLPTRVPLVWPKIPQFDSLKPFFSVAATLIARTAVGMVAYFAMAVVATRLGTVGAASHQVAMQIFWFISFFPEPLSMAAQSLIAKERGIPSAAKKWAWLLVRQGLGFGFILAAAVAGALYFAPGMFTTDAAVHAGVQSLAPLGAIAMAICSVMMMFDGISIGAGTFRHLPAAVALGMAAVLGALWVGVQSGGGLAAVWYSLIAFYATRLAGHLVYYAATWKTSIFCGFGEEEGRGEHGGEGNGFVAVQAAT